MLVVNRFQVDDAEAEAFRAALQDALDLLETRAGYVEGALGRNLDDPALWVLHTRWRDVGSYRRALSSYDVKVQVVPLLSRAVDEPSAYEEVSRTGAELNAAVPRELG